MITCKKQGITLSPNSSSHCISGQCFGRHECHLVATTFQDPIPVRFVKMPAMSGTRICPCRRALERHWTPSNVEGSWGMLKGNSIEHITGQTRSRQIRCWRVPRPNYVRIWTYQIHSVGPAIFSLEVPWDPNFHPNTPKPTVFCRWFLECRLLRSLFVSLWYWCHTQVYELFCVNAGIQGINARCSSSTLNHCLFVSCSILDYYSGMLD